MRHTGLREGRPAEDQRRRCGLGGDGSLARRPVRQPRPRCLSGEDRSQRRRDEQDDSVPQGVLWTRLVDHMLLCSCGGCMMEQRRRCQPGWTWEQTATWIEKSIVDNLWMRDIQRTFDTSNTYFGPLLLSIDCPWCELSACWRAFGSFTGTVQKCCFVLLGLRTCASLSFSLSFSLSLPPPPPPATLSH